jgi:hypothetical protein
MDGTRWSGTAVYTRVLTRTSTGQSHFQDQLTTKEMYRFVGRRRLLQYFVCQILDFEKKLILVKLLNEYIVASIAPVLNHNNRYSNEQVSVQIRMISMCAGDPLYRVFCPLRGHGALLTKDWSRGPKAPRSTCTCFFLEPHCREYKVLTCTDPLHSKNQKMNAPFRIEPHA